MADTSNNRGRALEYRICKEITTRFLGSALTERAKAANERDSAYYSSLPEAIRQDFGNCAHIVCEWLESKLPNQDHLTIDRLPDSKGVKGDPTDILISSGTFELRLSIKNNYPALKHQRLTRLPQQCGITDPEEVAAYTKARMRIWGEYYSKVLEGYPTATKFGDVRDLTFSMLYSRLNDLVVKFYNEHQSSAPVHFRFLTGTSNFYLVKNSSSTVRIFDFSGIPSPKIMQAFRLDQNNIFLEFDNGWKLKLRFHTASSRLYKKSGLPNRSIKMDTTFPNMDVAVPHEDFEK